MAPRWLVRLLESLLPAHRHDDVVGDLHELHARRRARWGGLGAMLATLTDAAVTLAGHALSVLADAPRGRWFSLIEVRLALRMIRKEPFASLTSVVALGVGIGIVAGGFSVFQQGLSSTLPFPNGDRWVRVEAFPAGGGSSASFTPEHVRALRAGAPALAYVGAALTGAFNVVLANDEVERLEGARVTPGTFRYLPYVPVLGRLFDRADGDPGATPVALIRESLWRRRFSGAPEVLGAVLNVAGTPYTVVGVLPDGAGFPAEGELWLPLEEEALGAASATTPVARRLVGILADGATPHDAERQAEGVAARIAGPGTGVEAMRVHVGPFGGVNVDPRIYVAVAVFMSMLLAVFLVIAANVANLVMARTSRRSVEFGVRSALGASRGRLVGQVLVEMGVVAFLASLLGLAAAAGILHVWDGLLDELPFWVTLRLRPSTAVAVAVLAFLGTGMAGGWPAFRATRRPPGDVLRAGGRGAGLGVGRVGGTLIALEVTLAVALLGAATVYAQAFKRYVEPDFRLPDARVLTARLVLEYPSAPSGSPELDAAEDSLAGLLTALAGKLQERPDVRAVGFTSALPRSAPFPSPVEVEGSGQQLLAPVVALGPGLLDVLESPPVVGRDFRPEDAAPGAPPVALVNRAFAMRYFGTDQVLGRRVRAVPEGDGVEEPWREIVGVVPDVLEVAAAERAAGIYVPLVPRRFLSLAVRVDGDPLSLTGALRQAAYDVDPDLNVSQVVRLDEVGAENRTALAVMSGSLLGIGLVTLLLSLAGVYAIVSLAVTRRTREIGVRVALGAEPGRILWGVFRSTGSLVLGGGVVGAAVGVRLAGLPTFVFAVPDAEAWLFPALVLLMVVAGAVACWVPARRALAIQPVEALRSEG